MPWIERKVRTAVLQQHARIPTNQTAAKALVEALDQRDQIALSIRHTQVHRVALFFQPWGKVRRCLPGIDPCPLLLSIALAQKLLDGHMHKSRIRNILVPVSKGQFFRLEE